MDGWEYCEAEIHVEGHLLGQKKWLAQVIHFAPDGAHRVEKLTTDFVYDPDRPGNARDAMGQVLAFLGRQGWELVRYQGTVDGRVREALLKRRSAVAAD
jgi:hypothetical protein